MTNGKIRLRRIRNRLLGQSAVGVICNLLLWFSLSAEQGHCFMEHWQHNAEFFLLFILLPGMIIMHTNWKQDKSAVSDMWAFGQRSFEDISHELAARKAIESDIKDSKPYIRCV